MNIQSLGYAVNEVLADRNVPQGANFEQALHFAGWIYRDMNVVGLMPTTKSKRLLINQHTHSCKIPGDCVQIQRIAMVCVSACGYETLINLFYNDDIALHGEDTRLHCTNEQAGKVINGICDYHDNLHGRIVNPNWQPGQSQWSSAKTGNQWDGDGWGATGSHGGCGCGCCDITSGELKNTQQGVWQQGESTCRPMPGAFLEQGCSVNGMGPWGDAGFAAWGWGAFGGGVYNYSAVNYGIGPGFYRGGYRINKELNTIQFDSCFNCHKIVIEYTSNGIDSLGDALVPVDCLPAMNQGIHWKINQHGQGTLPEKYLMRKDAKEFKQMYYALKEDIFHRLNSMTADQYLDIFRRYTFLQVHV